MLLHDEWLYLTGGLEARESVPAVFRARVDRDGALGAWEKLPDLPRPRSHHAMVVHRGALYLIGGLDGNPAGANTPLDDVIRAEIRGDGTLGEWKEVSKLPHAYGTHASAVAADALWLFGGVEDNARFVNVVLRAPLARNGSLGAWVPVEPGLPAARSHVHQVPVLDGRAYSVAGSNRRVVTGDVWYAALR
jgi:N-acetylneuraminic acid mutarotase